MASRVKKMGPRRIADSGSSHRKRTFVLIGCGVLIACVTLAVGLALATGGGGGKARNIAAQTAAQTTTAQTQATTPTTGAQPPAVDQIEVPALSIYRRRNPFKPLVDMVGTNTTTGTSTPTTTGTGPGSGVVTVPSGLVSGGNTAGSVISREITLDGVVTEGGIQYARLRVADQLYDRIAVGDTFGDNFKLLSIGAGSSATILFGDERMTVYTGQSIYW